MKEVTRFAIREDYDALAAAMDESFLKASDPSLSVLNFIEEVSNAIGPLKRAYAADARDRNQMQGVIETALHELRSACDVLEHAMQVTQDDPEDANQSLPDDADS